jgi:hypothetical protein
MDNLIKNLRNLAAFAHGDVSFADEAADEIERLQAREARLREAMEKIASLRGLHADDIAPTTLEIARAALGEEKK